MQLITTWAYGFHKAKAALALIMVTVGPIEHVLPHERRQVSDPWKPPTPLPGDPRSVSQ